MQKNLSEVSRWYIDVTMISPLTGQTFIVARHECIDLAQARTLLSEIRDVMSELSVFIPGLSANGYERQLEVMQ